MQTFLPYPSFKESALVLDYRRLGKQRVECKQILQALRGGKRGWVHHAATKMWRGHEYTLCEYAIAICKEWRARGYKDEQLPYFEQEITKYENNGRPKWLGDPNFHLSHRSNLVRKKAEHYIPFFGNIQNDLPYIWPRP